jgi:hypothetical protein
MTAAAILAPSCIENPSAFLDGFTVAIGAAAILAAVAAWTTRPGRTRRRK